MRGEGYYWVGVKVPFPPKGWIIAYCFDGIHWTVCGSSEIFDDDYLAEIGPRIERHQ